MAKLDSSRRFFLYKQPHFKLDSLCEDIAAGEDCTIVK